MVRCVTSITGCIARLGQETEMRKTRAILMATVFATTSIAGTAAWADRGFGGGDHHYYAAPYGHNHHYGPGLGWGAGLVLGSALLWAATRPANVIYQEPPAMVAAPAPIYAQPPSDGWWYYCAPAGAYYPYVQSCPVAWQQVQPR
jgi:hypothetical protein